MFAFVFAATALALVAACSTFSGDEPQADGGTADGGGGPAEGGGADASVSLDAAIDAALPFCKGQPDAAFCADFEDGKPAAASFPLISGNGTVDVVDTLAFGGRASMRAVGRSNAYATARRLLVGSVAGGKLTLSYRARVSDGDSGAQRTAASRLSLKSGTNECDLEIHLGRDNALFRERYTTNTPVLEDVAGVYGPDTWFAIVLSIATGPDGKLRVHVKVDGIDALAPAEFISACPNDHLTALPVVELGVLSTNAEFQLHFDNVLIDAK